MSSMAMKSETHQRLGEFTLTWSIQNFSDYLLVLGKEISSPNFRLKFLDNSFFWLTLHQNKERDAPDFISCSLHLYYSKDTFNNTHFTVSIRNSNDQFIERYAGNVKRSNRCPKFLNLEELRGTNEYLINDTLTIRYRIWKTEVDIPASIKWEAHSRVKISKLDYTWIVDGILASDKAFENEFNKTIEIARFFIDWTCLEMQVFKKGSLDNDATIHFGMKLCIVGTTCEFVLDMRG